MVLVSIFIIILSLFISKIIYRDLMSPSILIKIPWLVSLVLLLFSNFDYNNYSLIYLYFAIGLVLFDLSFILASKGKLRELNKVSDKNYLINEKLIKGIIVIEIIIISIYLVSAILYIRSNFVLNMYFTLKSGSASGAFSPSVFFGYFNTFIISFTSLVIFAYAKSANFKRKKILLFIQLIVGILSVMLTLGRTSILLFAITNLALFIVLNNIKNIKIIKYGIIFLVFGLVFFIGYNFLKYPYMFNSGSLIQVAFDSLTIYSSGSLVAFEKAINSGVELIYGENTFRFIYAVLSKIFGGFFVQPLTNQFISIGNNNTTNVYTIYYYYVKDYGMIYALMVQILLGSVYGFLYRRVNIEKPVWLFFYSLSLYPLFMQFFQDQYVSLTSTWIQFIVIGIILFNTKMFIKIDK